VRVALTGLALSGKTSLFDALTAHTVDSAVHPARADHPNVHMVKIPDERVDFLSDLYKSAKTVYATMELLDLPGIATGSEPGAADRPRIIAHLRQADALLYCLRAFESSSVPPRKGKVDPRRDYNELRSEFFLADLEAVLRRIEKVHVSLGKNLPKKERELVQHELELLQRCQEALEKEQPLRPLLENPDNAALVSGFGFLSQKPVIVVLNVDEKGLRNAEAARAALAGIDAPVYVICAQAESDILQLPEEERPAFLADLGIAELTSRRLVHDIHKCLDEITFLTTGPDETRSWPVPRNSTAVVAAGAIHSDLAKGFIRAEVIAYEDLRAAGSEKAVRAAGKFRLEGKEYLVKDGDILVIRFSV
jgi:hypothetical protein